MNILPLYSVPHHAERVVDWLWQEFGDGLPREFLASVIQHSQTPDALPMTFVALDGEQLLGTVGLWRCDLITRQDLFPWLAALYVDESYRGRGLSERLQQTVIDCCLQRGDRHLYLYSACADYYERFGWRYIGDALDYPATRVRLYHKALG